MTSISTGTLLLNQQFSPGLNNDPFNTPSYSPTPIDVLQAQQVFAQFAKYLSDTQLKLTANTVGPDNIMSTIALSPETILISASKIGIVGEVTFTDWLRDVNGVSTGVLDPSITTIRGGVIHTGIIYNADNSNYLDLDATGTTPFLVSSSGVSIKANGQFTLGATTGKQLIWDGTNLSIGNNALLNTTPVSTVLSGSSLGATAMQANLANVLSGSGAVEYGSVSWSGGVASGTSAVAISANGIAGFSSTGAGFYISATTGDAVFTGNVSAGSVTSSTYIDVSGYVVATGTILASGVQAAITGKVTSASTAGICGTNYGGSGGYGVYGVSNTITGCGVYGANSGNGPGVYGNSVGGPGVEGDATASGSIGVLAYGSGGATALQIEGPMVIDNSSLVTNLNAQYWNGSTTGAATTGTATLTIAANKPGASGNVLWLPILNTSGTVTGYLMVAPP